MFDLRRRTRGFTLVELLVVVAIIALLISILLPSLSRAKEQARIALDMSNQRSIVSTSAQYIMDKGNICFAMPFQFNPNGPGGQAPDNYPNQQGFTYATEFIWGGGMPSAREGDWDPMMGHNPMDGNGADVYLIQPAERPLNKYFDETVSWTDTRRRGLGGGADTPGANRRKFDMDLPDYFKCPSDTSAAVPFAGADPDPEYNPETIDSTWYWWGTSYAINWYWGYFYTLPSDGVGELIGTVDWDSQKPSSYGVLTNGAKSMLEQKNKEGSSEWILFYENQMNFAMEAALPKGVDRSQFGSGYSDQLPRRLTGWHKQLMYHVASYYDGHAEYRFYETSFVDGPGWTTWPSRDQWGRYEEWAQVRNE